MGGANIFIFIYMSEHKMKGNYEEIHKNRRTDISDYNYIVIGNKIYQKSIL